MIDIKFPLKIRDVILTVFISLLFLYVSPILALNSEEVTLITEARELEKDPGKRTKLLLVLIKAFQEKGDHLQEIVYRNQLKEEIAEAPEFQSIVFANHFRLGTLYFKTDQFETSLAIFQDLLPSIQITDTENRHLILSHLIAVSKKLENTQLREKYLSLLVSTKGLSSEFYKSSGGYKELLDLTLVNQSNNSHDYFEEWSIVADSNGEPADYKMVLNRWINFTTDKPDNFLDTPFIKSIERSIENNKINEAFDLMKLYAEHQTNQQKKINIYEDIVLFQNENNLEADIEILSFLWQYYQENQETAKELDVLTQLANRTDYKQQNSALKRLASLALNSENWLLALQSHKTLLQIAGTSKSSDIILILNNIIFISQKLSNDKSFAEHLNLKIFISEDFITPIDRVESLKTLLRFYQENKEFTAALETYTAFALEFTEITNQYAFYEIHFLAGKIAENNQDYQTAFDYYNLAVKLGETKHPVPVEIIKIALKTSQMAENHFSSDVEIQTITSLIGIYEKNDDLKNEAKYNLILAQKHQKLENLSLAETTYQKSLEKYRVLNDQTRIKQILTALANLKGNQSEEERITQLVNLEQSILDSENKDELIKIRFEIGNVYKIADKSEEALTYYLKALNSENVVANHLAALAGYYAALIQSQNQQFETANQILDRLINQYQFTAADKNLHSDCLLSKAKLLNTIGNYDLALDVVNQAVLINQTADIFLTKGLILMSLGNFQAAIPILNQALEFSTVDSEKIRIHIQLAKSYTTQKNHLKTSQHVQEGLILVDENTDIKLRFDLNQIKSQSLIDQGKSNEGIQNQVALIQVLEEIFNQKLLTIANLTLSDFYLSNGQVNNALQAVSQTKIQEDTNKNDIIRILLNFAKINRTLNKIKSALDYLADIDQHLSPDISDQLQAEVYYQRGYTLNAYGNIEEALKYFIQSESYYKKAGNDSDAILASLAQANVLMKQGKIAQSEATYNILLSKTSDDPDLQADIYASLALLFSEIGQYNKALRNSEKAEEQLNKANNLMRLPEIFNARGIIHLKMKDFEQSEILLLKALKTNTQYNNPLLDSELENNLGGLYKEKGDLKKARIHLIKSGELQKSLGFESLLALTFNNIGSVYLEEKKYKEALAFLRQSRSFAQKFNLKKELAVSWNNEGILFFRQEDFQSAKKAFQEALTLQKALNLKIDTARTLNNLSIIESNTDAIEKALDFVQQAIASLSLKEITSEGYYPNPAESSVLAPNLMKDFLQNKGAFLRVIAEKTTDSVLKARNLEAAYLSFELSINLIENLRTQIKSAKSQQLLLQSNIDIYQQLIAILFELGNLTGQQSYHKKAFFYAEKSRARSFLDQLQEQVARASLKLPQAIQAKENNLKSRISVLDANIFSELSKPEDQRNANKIEQWQIEKTDVQIQYTKLTLELEEKFPAYASLKYPKVYGTQEVLSQLLDNENQVIVYFLGKDVSYGWQLSQKVFKMIALPPAADIDKLIRKYRTTLVDPLVFQDPDDDEYIFDGTNTHLVTGLQVYRTFLKPLVENSNDEIKNLLIIPDGVLYYLPFETVLVKLHPKDNKFYKKGREYLLNRYSIYYSPSTSVLGMIKNQISQRDSEEMSNRKMFIGFGDPQYKPKRSELEGFEFNPTLNQLGFYELSRLFNTIDELDNISSLYPNSATSYLRDEAKEIYAKQNLNGYKYVHFATHGIMDEENPQFSGVVLNLVKKEASQDGFLQASEIFDLKLNADLVTLSACETGLGKVIKGEGMVGLTRAFLYAGSPSIVVSLWTVADESTSKLMIYFYEFLSKGFSKNEALRQAKLTLMHLEDDEELIYNDPFFWGPFILNGLK